jgi:myosin heavy subunit
MKGLGAAMLFRRVRINYFGRFNNKEIELKPGINLIYGENEAGKSTLHTFIKGMLFGLERLRGRGSAGKEDLYTRYLPWDYPGAYGGSMDIELGEKTYRLTRSFHASDKSFTILDLASGREVKLKEGLIAELIPGLTESTFRNTISIEQLKARTDSELAKQVQNYITNLSLAKSKEVNVAKAIRYLTEQRKQLESLQNPDTLKQLQAEIEDGLAKEERMDCLTSKLQEQRNLERQLQHQKELLTEAADQEAISRMAELPAILEKFRTYQELQKQLAQLRPQEEDLHARLLSWRKEEQLSTALKEDRKEAEALRIKVDEQERLLSGYQMQQEKLKKAGRNFLFISIIPAILTNALLFIYGKGMTRIYLGAFVLVVAAMIYFILYRRNTKARRQQESIIKELREQGILACNRLDEILKKHGVSSLEAMTKKQEELLMSAFASEHAKQQLKELEQRRKETEDKQDVLYDAIMKYLQYFIPAEELTIQLMQALQEEIRSRKQEYDDRQSKLSRQMEQCKLQIAQLEWEISSLEGNEERLIKNQEEYQELVRQQKENAVELEAIRLALGTISELSLQIHDSFGQQLNLAVSEVISRVTDCRYQELKIDEKLEVKMGWNGDYIQLERFSAGTIDQVYFSLRLAVADLLLGKEELPLLLDDSFALYDDRRVKAALGEVAKRKQAILFTCHRREQELLDELGLPYHLIDLSIR